MTTLVPYYRLYDLPWSPTEEVERRFRKVLRNAFIVFAILLVFVIIYVRRSGALRGAYE